MSTLDPTAPDPSAAPSRPNPPPPAPTAPPPGPLDRPAPPEAKEAEPVGKVDSPLSGALSEPTSAWKVGAVVVHKWHDHLDGPQARAGRVLEVQEPNSEDPEGTPVRYRIGWFAGISGPMTDDELTLVEGA